MAAITLSGFNGVDFNSILNTVMQYESQPLTAMQDEQAKIQNKDSAFVSLAGMISALQTQVTSLTSAASFLKVAAASSDTTIASVSAGDDGEVGQYQASIGQMAKIQVTKSTNGYSAPSDVAATGGSISFTIGGQTTAAIDITANTTLAELKQKINDQKSGVVASIVNDGTNYKLVISSRETGEANGFTINNSLVNGGGTGVGFTAGQSATTGNAQNAQNALFNVNGIDIESASNKVTDAIPGVTITLLKAGDTNVDVTKDFSPIKDALKAVVSQYNKLRDFNNDQTKGPLSGDTVLRETLKDIRQVLLGANSNSGQYQYLAEIGLEFQSDGTLKLDESKFDDAVNSHAEDVQKLFQGDTGSAGVFGALTSTLSNLDGTAGLIKTTRDSIHTTLDRYRDRIERQQNMLEIRRQQLIQQYAAADQAMSRLSQLTSSLSNLQRNV
jgi:flagellar hook-associated protein 2